MAALGEKPWPHQAKPWPPVGRSCWPLTSWRTYSRSTGTSFVVRVLLEEARVCQRSEPHDERGPHFCPSTAPAAIGVELGGHPARSRESGSPAPSFRPRISTRPSVGRLKSGRDPMRGCTSEHRARDGELLDHWMWCPRRGRRSVGCLVVRPQSCTRPAGVSPVRVIAGEPGSMPRSVAERRRVERGVKSFFGGSKRAGPWCHQAPRLQPRHKYNGGAEPLISRRTQHPTDGR